MSRIVEIDFIDDDGETALVTVRVGLKKRSFTIDRQSPEYQQLMRVASVVAGSDAEAGRAPE